MTYIKYDTVLNSRIDNSCNGLVVSRGFIATGIAGRVIHDPYALLNVLQEVGFPQLGDDLSAVEITGDIPLTGCIAKRHLITGVGPRSCRGSIIYESPASAGSPSGTFVFQDTTENVQEQTQIDLNRQPIQVRYTPPGKTPDLVTATHSVNTIKKTITMTVERPLRVLRVSGFLTAAPDISILNAQDTVNLNPWYDSAPKGYWLCYLVDVSADTCGNVYPIEVRFKNRMTRDWSNFGMYVSPDGVAVPGTPAADINTLMNLAYSTTQNNTTANGCVKVGMYDLTDFATVFGFG
jgi:hypothetical protein